jgi:excisionase family DNA binding protein
MMSDSQQGQQIPRRWYTVAEVAQALGFGLSKTKMLVITGEIRSIKHGHHRRIPPGAVDEFVRRVERGEAL